MWIVILLECASCIGPFDSEEQARVWAHGALDGETFSVLSMLTDEEYFERYAK